MISSSEDIFQCCLDQPSRLNDTSIQMLKILIRLSCYTRTINQDVHYSILLVYSPLPRADYSTIHKKMTKQRRKLPAGIPIVCYLIQLSYVSKDFYPNKATSIRVILSKSSFVLFNYFFFKKYPIIFMFSSSLEKIFLRSYF